MVDKGFIKADNFKNSKNKIAYLYYLTPKGFEEKTKITYRYMKRKMAEYEKLEEEIQQLQKEVNQEHSPRWITGMFEEGQNIIITYL